MRSYLSYSREQVLQKSPLPITVYKDNSAMIQALADDMLAGYDRILSQGKAKAVFIAPVGPVGQYDLIAQRCSEEGKSLSDLVLIGMDEYLDEHDRWIRIDDALSFRGHMERHFYHKLRGELAPPPGQRFFPDPEAPERIGEVIEQFGGVDIAYAGVGITGHLAFNDPVFNLDDARIFGTLPTRIVSLSPQTITINSVTASRGNMERIPGRAVTVGMREILSAQSVRVYMNRSWQCAAVRHMLFGEVTGRFPASLLQTHPAAALGVTEEVLLLPEPELR